MRQVRLLPTQESRQDRGMPTLPKLDRSLLVRTDFSDDAAWELLANEAQRENHDGFRAYVEPVNDPSFDGASWEAVKAAIPTNDNGAAVLFVADAIALASPDHPILVVDLMASRMPFSVHSVRTMGRRQQPEHREHGLGGVRGPCS